VPTHDADQPAVNPDMPVREMLARTEETALRARSRPTDRQSHARPHRWHQEPHRHSRRPRWRTTWREGVISALSLHV